MICGSGVEGRKVGSLKRHARSHLARWELKNCTPLWHEAHFQVKMYKPPHARTTFGSCDVEKVHAVFARSKVRSQNVQSTSASEHFLKLRCRKSAHRCGAKQGSKSKCTKHTILGALSEVDMSKKCRPLWPEAHFQVKMLKPPQVRTTFGSCNVEKCTPLWREAHVEVKMFKARRVRTTCRRSDVVLRGRRKGLCTLSKVSKTWGFVAFSTTNTTLHSNTLPYNYNYTFTTFHYTPLHYTTLHYTTLPYTTVHYSTLHYIPLHYTTLHYTPLHYTTTTLRYIPLHYTTPH